LKSARANALFHAFAFSPFRFFARLDTLLLLLFMLSAAVGLWAGYDRDGALAIFDNPVGWRKFWGLVLAALVYLLLAGLRTRAALRWAVGVLAGIGAATGLYLIATHDWGLSPADWEAFTALGRALQLGRIPAPAPNTNVAGGVLAPLLCLTLGLLLDLRRAPSRWAWLGLLWGTLTALVMTLSLLITTSRGAWLGVGAALYLTLVWQGLRARVPPAQQWRKFRAWLARDALTILMFLLLPWFRALLAWIPDIANRQWLAYRGLLLARDFAFTGCGLGSFALPDAVYAELIHVPTMAYSHALLVDVALEQGIPGAFALLTLWMLAFWRGLWALARRAHDPPPLLVAGLLALLAIALHSLGDNPFGTSAWLPLLWVPVGVVMASLRIEGDQPVPAQRRWGGVLGVALFALAGWGAARLGPSLPAAWYANLGAVSQAQTELPHYNYKQFAALTLDDIRQQQDLSVAESYYRLALTLDPAQPTARTRLAQLALSRGDYDEALFHAQAAWDAGYRDRVVVMTYSDALIAHGRIEEGAALVRGLPRAAMRLEWQWYRYQSRGDTERTDYTRAALALLEP